MAAVKNFGNKFGLHEGFAAADGNTAVAQVVFGVANLGHDVIHRGDGAAVDVLAVGVVAVEAAQGATLGKHHKANTGAIDGATGFDGVDAACLGAGGDRGRQAGEVGHGGGDIGGGARTWVAWGRSQADLGRSSGKKIPLGRGAERPEEAAKLLGIFVARIIVGLAQEQPRFWP